MSDGSPSTPTSSEPELLARIRAGDRRAFEEVFRAHYRALVAFVHGYVRSRAEAEELVQEVFLGTWLRREGLAATDSVRGYLYRSARNQALNHLRHRRVEREWAAEVKAADPPRTPAGDSAVLEKDLAAAVRRAVDALPERCRMVFSLSRDHGLGYAEIAEAMEISVKTVETQMTKALRALREAVKPYT